MKNTFKNSFYGFFIFIFFSVLAISCDKHEDFEAGKTALSDASGDWYVRLLVDDEDIYGIGYRLITTANSADETSIWVDDHSNIWSFKVKCPIAIDNMKFSGDALDSNVDDYEITVNILNGSVIKDGTVSPGGNVVDSIYFEAQFSDDPATTYQLTGYKRTGFAEDEQ